MPIETKAGIASDAPGGTGGVYLDVLGAVGPDFVAITQFDTRKEALASALSGKVGSGIPLAFFRCPYDPVLLGGALSTEVSTLAMEARNALTTPDATLLAAPATAGLMASLGLKSAN